MYWAVIVVVLLSFLNMSPVTSQGLSGLNLSPSFAHAPSDSSLNPHSLEPKQRCVLQCPHGYLPGTCLCQDEIFPFIFTATPCRFTKCRPGEVCRMREGKAVCKIVYIDTPNIDVCNLHPEQGPCTVYMQRFFFDKSDGHCKTFTYGGCQGNGNSFATKSECESTCIAHVPHSANHHAGDSSVAQVPVDTGNINPAGKVNEADQAAFPSSSSSSSSSGPSSHQIEICQLPFLAGPCFAHFPSFYFNAHSGQCESFVYGGCGGNENRFETREACETACRGAQRQSHGSALLSSLATATASLAAQPQSQSGQYLSQDVECNLPKAEGLCLAYMPSFFYNAQTGECETFVYGGCQGNANRFQSKVQCEQKCKSNPAPRPNVHADCQQPKTVGRCRANIQRWYFDQTDSTCKVFYYGGCGGNNNNFRTKTLCERKCSPQPELAASSASETVVSSAGVQLSASPSPSRPDFCSLPKLTGPCRASMPSYYFNPATSACEMFIYGGCNGNDNRFEMREDCEATCQATKRVQNQPGLSSTHVEQPIQGSISIQPLHNSHDVCQQPKLPGPCHASMPRYYFNRSTGQCHHFIYKGCGGNANNFRSYGACVDRCVRSNANGGRRFIFQ